MGLPLVHIIPHNEEFLLRSGDLHCHPPIIEQERVLVEHHPVRIQLDHSVVQRLQLPELYA